MSVQAIAWAVEQQEVDDPLTQLVLMCLANYADAIGRNAFPAIGRLCRDTRLSESSVRRHLKKLESMALIVKGNKAVASAHVGRADRCPVIYDLIMDRGVTQTPRSLTGCQSLTPREGHGVSGMTSRGVTEASTGCQSLTPNPKKSVREPKSDKKSFEEEFRSRFGAYPDALVGSTQSKRGRP